MSGRLRWMRVDFAPTWMNEALLVGWSCFLLLDWAQGDWGWVVLDSLLAALTAWELAERPRGGVLEGWGMVLRGERRPRDGDLPT